MKANLQRFSIEGHYFTRDCVKTELFELEPICIGVDAN
jgi:hypothetical protein